MQLFQRSLSGSALQWFARLEIPQIRTWPDLTNAFLKKYGLYCELTIDRCYLMGMSRKPTESFREYALR
ncbi:hypothetical protein HYC85_001564 [Camellia sinensis]|uniref:Retrotransposon gag domain-containing protein n=1 Tax=Camellia sinensis TaxID=4442 RepID=A0A7J7I6C3_CAMSI|nr:hypothetical protein HYC85_001564 [Camellia sinensis]